MKKLYLIIILILLSACNSSQSELVELPTRYPTLTSVSLVDTQTPSSSGPTIPASYTPTLTLTKSITPTPSLTLTNTPSLTYTVTLTNTSRPSLTPTPSGDAVVIGAYGVNLRSGPSQRFTPAIALLEPDTGLYLTAISVDSEWYQVQTIEGQTGWVFGELIEITNPSIELPTVYVEIPTEVPTAVPVIVVAPTNPPVNQGGQITNPGGQGAFPVSAQTRQIYQRGRTSGNQPNVYSKVGDSITANQAFMLGFSTGEYNLGAYSYLQGAIDFFAGSHNRKNLAAFNGFNAAAMLDPFWATDPQCTSGETPLACEYRVHRPSIAIIMLGSVDVQIYPVEDFSQYLSEIVDYTISQNIIPVLTTFPNEPSYYPAESEAFNQVIYNLATQHHIPLIDLRTQAMAMPGYGVGTDRFHLSQPMDWMIDFNGGQNQYGLTLRNLLTLQMLDSLWRGIPMN